MLSDEDIADDDLEGEDIAPLQDKDHVVSSDDDNSNHEETHEILIIMISKIIGYFNQLDCLHSLIVQSN